MRGLLLACCLLALGCEPLRGDPCADRRAADLTCVGVQLEGDLGELDVLGVTVSGDWVGYTEATSAAPFRLPSAVGVVLPAEFAGSVRLEVQALRGRVVAGAGALEVRDITPREHRPIELVLQPIVR